MTTKAYEVTITPKFVTYAGSWAGGEYTVTVFAKDKAQAIKRARADRADNEGPAATPAKFTARMSSDN
jgi:hypothetical protein